MKTRKTAQKALLLLITLAVFISQANAAILINAQTDKTSLATDEIGMLTIKLINDSEQDAKNIQLTIKADDQIKFIEEKEELATTAKAMEEIKSGKSAELKVKIKAVSAKKPSANIYIYYGTTQQPNTAFVTTIQTKDIPINTTAKAEKKTSNEKEYAIINFKLSNYTKENIYKIAAETIAPEGFELMTPQPLLKEILKENETLEGNFEILAPINPKGTQTITLAYGYFENNTPHYFEKNLTLNFEKPNNQTIIIIAIIIIITAGYLFMKKDANNEVKGTNEKKK